MSTFTIKTHSSKNQIFKPHFYILNKGLNSGKPLENPCPNCFVFSVETEAEKEFYYWLTFGLWQSKAFHPFLIGSVIPFIRIGEFKKCIQAAEEKAKENLTVYKKVIKALKLIHQQEQAIKQKLELIKQYKYSVFAQFKRTW
ncbi:MAG: hypothetical protein GXO80_11980 [Chlorobi bacterium]|nr:hypothetical protein [Chlorobiota bacterium]